MFGVLRSCYYMQCDYGEEHYQVRRVFGRFGRFRPKMQLGKFWVNILPFRLHRKNNDNLATILRHTLSLAGCSLEEDVLRHVIYISARLLLRGQASCAAGRLASRQHSY